VRKLMPNRVPGWTCLPALLALAVGASALDLPVPRNHVEDRAGVIRSAVEHRLDRVLTELERKTTAQVIVLTIDTTGGEAIDDFALRTANRWKLGQKGKDNGVLIAVAIRDRKYWISVGSGLEGALPDGFVGSIGRKYFRPYFRKGDYSTGIYLGTLAIVQKVAREYHTTIAAAQSAAPAGVRTARPARHGRGRSSPGGGCACGIFPLIVIFVLISIFRSRTGYYRRWGYGGSGSWLTWMLLGSMMGSGRRSSGWGGGGFGGGGFGGFGGGSFGGGGGGGFSGGGAGGGW